LGGGGPPSFLTLQDILTSFASPQVLVVLHKLKDGVRGERDIKILNKKKRSRKATGRRDNPREQNDRRPGSPLKSRHSARGRKLDRLRGGKQTTRNPRTYWGVRVMLGTDKKEGGGRSPPLRERECQEKRKRRPKRQLTIIKRQTNLARPGRKPHSEKEGGGSRLRKMICGSNPF